MKKWTYLLSGVVIGAILATSGSTYAAQIKSLIGQKVTGEYTLIVNGKTLQDKGAVVNNKTNAPVRALADALGADLQVSGNTLNISTKSEQVTNSTSLNNQYIGRSKSELLSTKEILENNILGPTIKGRDKLLAQIEVLKVSGAKEALAATEEQLSSYNAQIAKYTEELRLVNEALRLLEK